MAVITLTWGVRKNRVVVKQDDTVCNRDVGEPEEELVGKQDGAFNYVLDGRRSAKRADWYSKIAKPIQ